MFQSATTTVEVTVRDLIEVNVDGSVDLRRCFEFVTDETQDQPIEYVRREIVASGVEPVAAVVSVDTAKARLYSPNDTRHDRFVWELDGSVRSSLPLSVELQARLLGPNCNNPLEFGVAFDSQPGVGYRMRMTPPYPELTIPERTIATISPTTVDSQIERLENGALISTPTRVSRNTTGPLSIEFKLGSDLSSTKLLKYYSHRLAS